MRRILPALLATALLAQGCASSQAGTSTSVAAAPATVVTASTKGRIDSTLKAYVASGRLIGVSAVVWEEGAYTGVSQLGADTEATPLDVPVHPGAARWYKEHGYPVYEG